MFDESIRGGYKKSGYTVGHIYKVGEKLFRFNFFFDFYKPYFFDLRKKNKATAEDKIIECIIDKGKLGATLTDIHKATSNISAKDRTEMLQSFLDMNEIYIKKIKTDNSPKETTLYFKYDMIDYVNEQHEKNIEQYKKDNPDYVS